MEAERVFKEKIMKIGITGITGFVGQNLASYLVNYDVLGVSRESKGRNINYQELSLDIFNNQEVFVHLAGKAHDLKKTSEDSAYFEVNTELTKMVYDQFLKSDCETFIYMSSVKAVADVVDGILTEDVMPKPITVYGKSKLAAEEYILSQKLPEEKRVYILRPCMIHGPSNKGNLNLLYSFVSKGIPYPFGKYKNQRSFVSVENLCFVIKELIENKNIDSGIYNLADDTSLSTNELVLIIGGVIGKKIKILNIPKPFIKLIAKIGNFFPFPINSERVEKLTENYCVSNSKIKKAINKDLPLSAKKGVEKTIATFK